MTETIGSRLKTIREKSNLTINKTAEELGIKPRTYSAYESGQNDTPTKFLQDFIEYFGANGTWLITGKTDKEIQPKEIDIDLTKVKGITIRF